MEDLTRIYSPLTFNFWPYLRAREAELAEQRGRYLQSFLHHYYGTFEPIGRHLWASPDNPKQYTVAIRRARSLFRGRDAEDHVRFLISKLWFVISKCLGRSDATTWLHSVVIGAREVVSDEIWEVTTTFNTQGSTSEREETFYILEPTCEVIGRPTATSAETLPETHRGLPIRVDWSDYVNDHILSLAGASGKKLMDRVQWAHYEEYQNGISRHFLTQTQREGEVGKWKRRVAEKHILASVAENR